MKTREQAKIEALFNVLMSQTKQEFPQRREPIGAPTGRGVYVIYNPRGKVDHVGRTPKARGGIAQRLRNHLAGASSYTLRHLGKDGSKLRRHYQFQCLEVPDDRFRALLEAYAIGHLCPAHLGLSQMNAGS